jgi:hypothetical protein
MLYAKVIYTGVADHTSASDRQTVICGDRFDFMPNAEGKPAMCIHIGNKMEIMDLFGDVWIMNESGKTISQFAIPLSSL